MRPPAGSAPPIRRCWRARCGCWPGRRRTSCPTDRREPGMRVIPALALLAALLPAAAAAQERPVFPPTRDVAVTYRLGAAAPSGQREVVVRYSVRQDRLRVEGALPGYVLLDRRTRQATIVMESLGI